MVFEFGLFGLESAGGAHDATHTTALTHGEYYQMNNHADWHMQDDPWGAYLQSDGNPATQASNPQGHTQWTPVTNETWQNYNVTTGPYAAPAAPAHTTHLVAAHTTTAGSAAHTTTKLDGGGEYWDASILERPDNTASGTLWNPPDDESCCGLSYGAIKMAPPPAHSTHLVATPEHSTQLDGGGTYWDASIMERPGNTASGDLWNPPDDESCCGLTYGAVKHNSMLASSSHATPSGDVCQACSHHTAGGPHHLHQICLCACDGGDGGLVTPTPQQALAAPALGADAASHAASAKKPVRPSPGHYILALHSCSLGALEATGEVCTKMMKGEASEDLGCMWRDEFKKHAEANASAISPVARHIVAGM